MAQTGELSIRDCVGGALRFVREQWRFIFTLAGAGALLTATLTALALAVPVLGLLNGVGSGLVKAVVYAMLIGAVLYGPAALRNRWLGDGGRVWSAMVIIGLLLILVFFVLSIPVMMLLIAGPLGPYSEELTRAGSDTAQVMTIMTRFAEANPGAVLAVAALYTALWLFFTSRLYLAAPASVESGRVMSLETWNWTRGAALKIIGARLMLLLPANIFTGALGYLAGRLFGVDALNPAASISNGAALAVYIAIGTFVTFALYMALEAALSTFIYRALKPAPAPSPV